ncbi:pak-2 [Symbiodinium sp. KB8]|nr:pak-2 [Symbiodinium sp. KB8]
MSITLEVGLLSGKRVTVDADENEEVGTLKRRAQISLGVGSGRLVGSCGSVLDESSPIKRARLQNGDSLTLQVNSVQIQAARNAFAAILGDGTVVTWGRAAYGGGSSAVRDQLKNVRQIQASSEALAAILCDGSVVTWGRPVYGGDSRTVQDQLKNVQQIQASDGAFAAVLGDGSVVTWGSAVYGGDSSAVQDHLKNVQQIQVSGSAFAAILGDGSVVTWGSASDGGDSSAVRDQLKNVQQIQASRGAFAAVLGDGSVVSWGGAAFGGDSCVVQDQLKNVQQIQASRGAFAAVLGEGSVVTWGSAAHGGDSSAVQDQLKNVQQIQASSRAFAAILCEGLVVTWGHAASGGGSSTVQDQLKNLQQIQVSSSAFAAILCDGSVVTWGRPAYGGDSSTVQDQLKNVQQIQASHGAFAAVLGDGSVVTWGSAVYGGDSRVVQDQLKNVQQIQASSGAFAAILGDGSIVTWGNPALGGVQTVIRFDPATGWDEAIPRMSLGQKVALKARMTKIIFGLQECPERWVKTMQVGDRPRREQLLREIQGLVQAQGCECLVQWYAGMAEGGGSRLVHVVLEFMDLGSLADLLERLDTDSRVPLPSLRCAAAQVAIALEFLHSRSILHRDIKPQFWHSSPCLFLRPWSLCWRMFRCKALRFATMKDKRGLMQMDDRFWLACCRAMYSKQAAVDFEILAAADDFHDGVSWVILPWCLFTTIFQRHSFKGRLLVIIILQLLFSLCKQKVKEVHRLLIPSPDTVKTYVDDPSLQPIMAIMIAKWGGENPDEDDDGADDGEGDPSGGEDAEDTGEDSAAPAVVAAEPADPYMLPDGQLFVPFSDDEVEEMPALGDDPGPTPDNQKPPEMPVLGDRVPTPGNQEPPEMPVLGDDRVPTPDNQEPEMPVLGDHVPTDNQESEMPVLGDRVPTDNQEPEPSVLGQDRVPTPNHQEPQMPVLGDLVPTPDKSRALQGLEVTMVATPCVNFKPPPMIERKKLAEKQAMRSALHNQPASDPSSLDTQPLDIFKAAVRQDSITSAPEVFSVLDFKAEVSRTDQFAGKRKAADPGSDNDVTMDGHADDPWSKDGDKDDDEPVPMKRPAAKQLKTGPGRGRKPGSSAPSKDDQADAAAAAAKPKAKAKGKAAAKAKGKSDDAEATGKSDDAKATGKSDDEADEQGDAKSDDANATGKSDDEATQEASKPKAEAKGKAAKAKGKSGEKEKATVKAKGKSDEKQKAATAKGKSVEKEKGKAGEGEFKEKVFARRPRPNPPDQALQWQVIRDVFDSHIKPSLPYPSKHEYPWYDTVKPLLPADSTLDKYLKIARGQVSDFLKSVSKK